VLVLCAVVPVAVAASVAPSFGDWWQAVVTYRAQGDSILTGSVVHRLDHFVESVPPAAKALALLVLLAAAGWRRAPLLARIWPLAAVPGIVGGGNFHPHYYLQVVPPLAVLAGFGVRRLVEERRPRYVAVCAGAAGVTLAFTAPLWFASSPTQARTVWPDDPHLVQQARLAAFVRTHVRPTETVDMLWAAADVHYLADRRPTLPYLWYRNVEAVPGALALAQRMLRDQRPALVVVVQPPTDLDHSGRTSAILRRYYRPYARVAGVAVLRPRRLVTGEAEDRSIPISALRPRARLSASGGRPW
jgi:hypothetical protein